MSGRSADGLRDYCSRNRRKNPIRALAMRLSLTINSFRFFAEDVISIASNVRYGVRAIALFLVVALLSFPATANTRVECLLSVLSTKGIVKEPTEVIREFQEKSNYWATHPKEAESHFRDIASKASVTDRKWTWKQSRAVNLYQRYGLDINEYLRYRTFSTVARIFKRRPQDYVGDLSLQAFDMRKTVAWIDLAIRRSHLTTDLEVYRGEQISNSRKVPRVGDRIDVPQYFSASLNPAIAQKFASQNLKRNPSAKFVVYRVRLNRGQKAISMDAMNINWFDQFLDEHEILLPRGIKLKVMRREDFGSLWLIDLAIDPY